jgi:tetratricopeptide (TPR) repeat protein
MVQNVARIVLFGFLCALLMSPASTQAQQRVAALEREEAAQELATQAIAVLKRGEDARDDAAKIAAYREGLELARRAATADDSNADAHFAIFANQGRLMLLEGAAPNPLNLLKVNRELERCLELDPNHSDALAAQGGLYRQLPWLLGGNLDKAETALRRSIEIDPNAVGARIELALVYRDRGQPERGIELLERAIVLAEQMNKRRQLGEARRLLAELGNGNR